MALCSMVWLLEHSKKYHEALIFCDKALKINPRHVYALSYKGKLLLSLKQYEDAIKWYNKALEIEPDNQTAIYHKNQVVEALEKKNKKEFKKKFSKHL